MIGNGEMTSISPCPQVLVASSTSLGAVSEFFYGDSLQAVKAAHAAEKAHPEHGELHHGEDMGMAGLPWKI